MKPPGRLDKEWDAQWSPEEWEQWRKRKWVEAEEPVEVKLARFFMNLYENDVKRRRTE